MTNSLLNLNLSRGHSFEEICRLLKQHLNLDSLTHLEPLAGEPLGHIDMFVTVAAPNVVVVGQYDPAVDATNARILDENVSSLSKLTTQQGSMQVVRIPMPSHADGRWRTYTNVIYANGVLLVPQYPDFCPDLDAQAIEIFKKVLPGWKVVGVDSSKLITKNGALHCVSLNIPMLPDMAENF